MQSLGQIGVLVYCTGKPGYLSSFHKFPESIGEELFLDGTNQPNKRRILASQNGVPGNFPKNRQNTSGSGQRSENALDSHCVSRTESEAGIRRFTAPKSDVYWSSAALVSRVPPPDYPSEPDDTRERVDMYGDRRNSLKTPQFE